MSAIRGLLASVGLTLAGIGLLFVVAPGAAGVLTLPRVFVLVLGVIAVLQGLRSLQSRRRTGIDGAEPPEPEPLASTDRPGDDFDRRLRALGRSRSGTERERLRRRLQAAAVEAVGHRFRIPAEAARERVAAGDWTDDPGAAWFLGGPSVERPPLAVRVQAFLSDATPFGFYANRTADAVVDLREGP